MGLKTGALAKKIDSYIEDAGTRVFMIRLLIVVIIIASLAILFPTIKTILEGV